MVSLGLFSVFNVAITRYVEKPKSDMIIWRFSIEKFWCLSRTAYRFEIFSQKFHLTSTESHNLAYSTKLARFKKATVHGSLILAMHIGTSGILTSATADYRYLITCTCAFKVAKEQILCNITRASAHEMWIKSCLAKYYRNWIYSVSPPPSVFMTPSYKLYVVTYHVSM